MDLIFNQALFIIVPDEHIHLHTHRHPNPDSHKTMFLLENTLFLSNHYEIWSKVAYLRQVS